MVDNSSTPKKYMSRLPNIVIENWSAWAPNLTSKNDWNTWANNPICPSGNMKVETKAIPPMIKRRCSQLSKMCLEVAAQASQNQSVDYAVFCSQHGELDHSISLLQSICQQALLSPMAFVQSVHNTASGLYTIINKMQQNCTAIAAGDSTFLMGVLDAVVWLQSHPDDQVLLVMGDNYIPEAFQSLRVKNNHQYAVAFLLKSAKVGEDALNVEYLSSQKAMFQSLPLALEFLQWWLEKSNRPLQQGGPQSIKWQQA